MVVVLSSRFVPIVCLCLRPWFDLNIIIPSIVSLLSISPFISTWLSRPTSSFLLSEDSEWWAMQWEVGARQGGQVPVSTIVGASSLARPDWRHSVQSQLFHTGAPLLLLWRFLQFFTSHLISLSWLQLFTIKGQTDFSFLEFLGNSTFY